MFRGVQPEGKHLEIGGGIGNKGSQAVGAEVFRCLWCLGGLEPNEMTRQNPNAMPVFEVDEIYTFREPCFCSIA